VARALPCIRISFTLFIYNIIRFACSNRFWNRTEQVEPVLNGSVPVLFSSEKILSVRFSVLKKGVENRTELNFGNTTLIFRSLVIPHPSLQQSDSKSILYSKIRRISLSERFLSIVVSFFFLSKNRGVIKFGCIGTSTLIMIRGSSGFCEERH